MFGEGLPTFGFDDFPSEADVVQYWIWLDRCNRERVDGKKARLDGDFKVKIINKVAADLKDHFLFLYPSLTTFPIEQVEKLVYRLINVKLEKLKNFTKKFGDESFIQSEQAKFAAKKVNILIEPLNSDQEDTINEVILISNFQI